MDAVSSNLFGSASTAASLTKAQIEDDVVTDHSSGRHHDPRCADQHRRGADEHRRRAGLSDEPHPHRREPAHGRPDAPLRRRGDPGRSRGPRRRKLRRHEQRTAANPITNVGTHGSATGNSGSSEVEYLIQSNRVTANNFEAGALGIRSASDKQIMADEPLISALWRAEDDNQPNGGSGAATPECRHSFSTGTALAVASGVAGMWRPRTASDDVKFQLERFEWAAPDRLEIAGSFAGMAAPSAPPTLAIQGADGVRRLTGATEAPDDGPWTVAFLWKEPPIPFEAATLEFSEGLSVTLPTPGESIEPLSSRQGASVPAADALRLEAELVAAQADASEAQAAHDRLSEELARARADLEAERSRRAAESNRFKQGLAQVRDAGEQALAAAQAELTALRARIEELEGQLGELPSLRAELDRMASEADERRETLERAQAEQRALGEALSRAQAQAEETQAALEHARAEAAHADHFRARLTAVRQVLGDDP